MYTPNKLCQKIARVYLQVGPMYMYIASIVYTSHTSSLSQGGSCSLSAIFLEWTSRQFSTCSLRTSWILQNMHLRHAPRDEIVQAFSLLSFPEGQRSRGDIARGRKPGNRGYIWHYKSFDITNHLTLQLMWHSNSLDRVISDTTNLTLQLIWLNSMAVIS